MYKALVGGERFRFDSLKEVLAKANEIKSGDELAGIAARSDSERIAAKIALSEETLARIHGEPVIEDAITDAVHAAHDEVGFRSISALTVGEFREVVLSESFPTEWNGGLASAIGPEIAAATAKLMSDLDLIVAASRLQVVTKCRNTQGERGVFGCRIQPNHPTDDVTGIMLSALDGLMYGCGDAVIGVNPATESPDTVGRVLHAIHDLIELTGAPTQSCVLSHITTQLAALERGAPVDLLFQSVAGSEAANRSFGISLDMLAEGRDAVAESHRRRAHEFVGEQFMYFETGQGSALSADAHHGVDQLTLEARAQSVARLYDPFLVNSVVGFIGPEYLANSRQITRAGLEDHFVGKLMGLPMGCDVCYTNHVDSDQNDNDNLLALLGLAGCMFVMGVPAGDDVMLNYQSTSYHDVASVRKLLGSGPAPEFASWLSEQRGWDPAQGILELPEQWWAAVGARSLPAIGA
ncbi:ethanolamine ammonia-lyase subunit EutB [Rhodococcus sp. 14-2470-1a]|uniref:ethanolamine ammonia-lyase subunit EutB n=1 Tax=Rhodococcus sp. 14-2470-1a TaxID=2023150 RepID=UPI000B9B1FE5|nr:ethanolamine ammonia-lyase subunit EutB [Rhodococcus sp. 14-2470-1a]OZF48502.1 ethanolamine ammonia lyase large subunit [Rhodococcus sp. 14-2470-1a]